MMEYDIHTLLDLLTLAASLWAIYIVRFQLKSTYQADLDSVKVIFVV
jgi:ER lumen protein retaining receptor